MSKALSKAVLTVALATIWALFLLLGAHKALPETAWGAVQIIVGAFEFCAISISLYVMWREVTGGAPAAGANVG